MKKIIIVSGLGLFLALSIVLLVAFNNKPSLTPVQTIQEFHKAAVSGDVSKAKEFVTSDILTAFENGAYPHYGSFGGFLSDYKGKTESIKPVKKSVKITGDSATLDVVIMYKDHRESKETYYLIKEDGTWKIAE